MVATEYERCVHFEEGLKDNLRVLIAPQRERKFAVLVEKAKIAEEVKRAERQNCDREKAKRDVESSNAGRAPNKGAGLTEARQPTLVYVVRRREDGDAPDVIMGTSLILNVPYVALIDIGSTHSYIACFVSETLGMPYESASSEISVASPLGQSIRASKLFRDVLLEVQETIFLADLMELSSGEFNLILGMDWLVNHRVSLNCAEKRVVLRSKEDNKIVVIGER
ncbi:uncharacterized protein [Gossypium hirsutum]|uniref:Uncharacterized protein n=1 Tax=Gossypium hirsutum TaxID=3635 RepID=A0A1U8IHK5_GOSHI|nr:uncharacterized protein LOC107894603 [Gossypium hirsutum]